MDSTEDFAKLFEASTKAKRYERGQVIDARIVGIGKDVAFIDVGGKGEATIDLAELKDDEGRVTVQVGDRIQAMVTSTSGGLTLSYKLARGAATDRQLEDAYRSGLTVEGKVAQAVKGGFEVRIGSKRAFCPASQMDLPHAPPTTHEGRVYEFRIIEYKEGGRNVILSRRAILEEQQRADAVKVREAIEPGSVITGRVASVRDFGAFVDVGAGVQGLLHVSEMAWSRVNDPSQIVKPGDEITVRVLRVDEEKQKISLGLKQLTVDPWTTIAETYAVGQIRSGRVTRVSPFGAFVELEPGVDALVRDSGDQLKKGQSATFEIASIDVDKKRIAVELKSGAESVDIGDYQNPSSQGGLGSLGDKLRDALKRDS
ncbi:MAG TPA: S1 RNA-binding domain-containing protein [Vicinamibacterales bacterium]|nr:S1 RNA-binding domain-containing protein [Vicinamibacterales bacterium]